MTISAILTVVRGPSAPYTTPAECKNCTAELLADMNEVLIRYLLAHRRPTITTASLLRYLEQHNRVLQLPAADLQVQA